MKRNRPEFKAHDDFIFEHKKIGKVTRDEFIKFIRTSHEQMRELSQIIQQYDQTIDDYLKELDRRDELFDLAESVRVVNEEERI